jgi:hypothetical protein
MHPAPSVIVFSTFSGLGFGLLIFLGLGMPGVTGWSAFAFFVIAYLLAVGGLIPSTLADPNARSRHSVNGRPAGCPAKHGALSRP